MLNLMQEHITHTLVTHALRNEETTRKFKLSGNI